MNLTLIDNWKRAWRLTSVQAAALLVLLSLAQSDVLPLLQPLVSASAWPKVTAAFGAAIAVLRVIKQLGALDGGDGSAAKDKPHANEEGDAA